LNSSSKQAIYKAKHKLKKAGLLPQTPLDYAKSVARLNPLLSSIEILTSKDLKAPLTAEDSEKLQTFIYNLRKKLKKEVDQESTQTSG
jgi:hypothetical protein